MKTFIRKMIIAAGLCAMFLNGKSANASQPQLASLAQPSTKVLLNLSSAYVSERGHFDQESFAVVSGNFNNTCYHWRGGEAKLIEQGAVIEVRSYAMRDSGNCLMYLVPYTEKVSLGFLPRGQYQVRFINGDGASFDKPLTVD